MARLVVTYPRQQSRCIELGRRQTVVIGRATSCDVWLDDTHASRRHARLARREDGWFLVDLSSENGTYLNDLPIDEKIIHHGDRIRISGFCLRFELFDYVDN